MFISSWSFVARIFSSQSFSIFMLRHEREMIPRITTAILVSRDVHIPQTSLVFPFLGKFDLMFKKVHQIVYKNSWLRR